MYNEDAFFEDVRRVLRKIREIRQDTGYSTDQVLMAMLVVATACNNNENRPY